MEALIYKVGGQVGFENFFDSLPDISIMMFGY